MHLSKYFWEEPGNTEFFSQNWHFEYFQSAFKLTEKWGSLFGRKIAWFIPHFPNIWCFKFKISMAFRRSKVFIPCLGSAVLVHAALEDGQELCDVSDPLWLKLSEKSLQTLFYCKKNGILLCQKVNKAIMFWPQQIFKQGKKKSRSVIALSCVSDCYGNPIARSFGIWKPGQLLFLKP